MWGGEKEASNKNVRGGRKKKKLYDGLSAQAKGWLLAKHHFATLSIFQQLVKGSAATSLLPATPLLFSSFFTGEKKRPVFKSTKGSSVESVEIGVVQRIKRKYDKTTTADHRHWASRNAAAPLLSPEQTCVLQALSEVPRFLPETNWAQRRPIAISV